MSISILLQVLRTGGCRGSHSVYGVQNLVQPEQGLCSISIPSLGCAILPMLACPLYVAGNVALCAGGSIIASTVDQCIVSA